MMSKDDVSVSSTMDPVELQVFRHLLTSIPEEMGIRLKESSFSPNIKERLDFSCALTGPDGRMVAQASHIPVHLGSTHITARLLLSEMDLSPGDVVLLNDPWRGGTHLPDITAFAPVFLEGEETPSFGALVRAHHADVGGASPGSMGDARDVFGEGLVIPPVRLVRRGQWDQDLLQMVLANTRTPEERRGDLLAQVAAAVYGCTRVQELGALHGRLRLVVAAAALESHARTATEAWLLSLPEGVGHSEVVMDLPGLPKICVNLRKTGPRLHIDFVGTSGALDAPFNANEAITLSCVFYVIRLLLSDDLPTNSGCLSPLNVEIPRGCFLNAERPAPVAGGNVETSQAVVEALLLAFAQLLRAGIPAASQGTMNNVTVGGRRTTGEPWTFYETLGGGVGAGPGGPGASGLHSHMTNTMNTPVEALENAFPVRITAYHLRSGSGGPGQFSGGEGVVREYEFLEPAQVTVLAGRRGSEPPGALGGLPGKPGKDTLFADGAVIPILGAETRAVGPSDRLRVETPGGGGYGAPLTDNLR